MDKLIREKVPYIPHHAYPDMILMVENNVQNLINRLLAKLREEHKEGRENVIARLHEAPDRITVYDDLIKIGVKRALFHKQKFLSTFTQEEQENIINAESLKTRERGAFLSQAKEGVRYIGTVWIFDKK